MIAVLATASPVAAGIVVLRTSGEAVSARYRPGAVLSAGQIRLNTGEWVVVVLDGSIRRLEGPIVSSISPAKAAEDSLLAKVADAFHRVDARRLEFGAVRGGGAASPDEPEVLSVEQNATVCAPADRDPVLWRADAVAEMRASLEDLGTGERRFFTWPAGESRMNWPRELPLHDGAFLFRDATSRARTLQVRILPKAKGLELLAALADRDCLDQLDLTATTNSH